jgi:hypothetical protein
MKTNYILRAMLAVAASTCAAGAMAQTVRVETAAVQSTPMTTGGLSASPATLAFSIGGGLSQFKSVTITNGGPGFASNLAVSLSGNGGPPHDDMHIVGDTCTGATLANGGTCTVRLGFDSQCPKSWYSTWNLLVTDTGVPGTNVAITATSRGGECQ